ncbi:MAG: hypothetical protein J5911_00060 [Clostridia bacterium]|nr:hypothetical protein [Clostridia bacterium]
MKILKNLMILLMAVLALTALVACGGGGNNNADSGNGGNGGNGTATNATVEQDLKIFADLGVSAYEFPINSLRAEQLGTTEDALLTAVSAYKYDSENPENSVSVMIFYFKTEKAAQASYETVKAYEEYKLIGTKLVYGDSQNLITK